MQFIGFYLKQPSPLLWFRTDCSRERQFLLWTYTAAYAGVPSQPRYMLCWRASRFKYNLCKKPKQIRGTIFTIVGYNVSGANFIAATS